MTRQSPDVVVILVDDLGYSDFGPFGSELRAPNLTGWPTTAWC